MTVAEPFNNMPCRWFVHRKHLFCIVL